MAGATGLGASFVAGGLAKEKYDQFKVQSINPLVTSVKDNVSVNMKSMSLNAEEGRERTFIMIKPDGVQRGLVGEIIKRFEQKGFKLVAIRMMRPGKEHLEEHYADLAKRPFFPGLVKYMDSGPVVAMCWEGDGAVKTGTDAAGVKVAAEVVDHHRGPKIKVLRYKNKTGYRRRQGHRQDLTRLRVTSIG